MNILKSILLSIIALFLYSCIGDKSRLSEEELSNLLADMHISELSIKRHDEEYRDSLKKVYLENITKIHGLTEEEIIFEVELLNDDRDRQSEIYTLTINRLQELEKKYKIKINPKVPK